MCQSSHIYSLACAQMFDFDTLEFISDLNILKDNQIF